MAEAVVDVVGDGGVAIRDLFDGGGHACPGDDVEGEEVGGVGGAVTVHIAVGRAPGPEEEQQVGGIDITIAIDIPPDIPPATIDSIRIERVLHNLVENAIKDTPGPGWVRVQLEAEPQALVISVQDNGIGIAPRYHNQIFDLFEKLDAESEGTGIGLATVRRVINRHGGRVWAESTPGQGSLFRVRLPVVGEVS